MIYMLLQSGMFHYMLVQLHAYYMILHALTVDSMQKQALHANPVGPWDFEIWQMIWKSWRGPACVRLVRYPPHRRGNPFVGLAMLQEGTWHAKQPLLCCTLLG